LLQHQTFAGIQKALRSLRNGLYSRDRFEVGMPSNSQRRAIEAHRQRLAERGLGRFEVRGLEVDKELIRGIARRLAVNDEGADVLRADLARRVGGEAPGVGGILAALRRSPLAGADLDLSREETSGRDAGL
jgi:hypothetical protein